MPHPLQLHGASGRILPQETLQWAPESEPSNSGAVVMPTAESKPFY